MAPSITLQDFDAVLFDLDGVLTTTRAVHAAAWKRAFDEFLEDWDVRHDTSTEPFDDHADYAAQSTASRGRTACATSWCRVASSCPRAALTTPPTKRRCGGSATASSSSSRTSCNTPGSRSSPARSHGCGS